MPRGRKELTTEQEVMSEQALQAHVRYKTATVTIEDEVRREVAKRLQGIYDARDIAIRNAVDAGLSRNFLIQHLSCSSNLVYDALKRTEHVAESAEVRSSVSQGQEFERIMHEFEGREYDGIKVRIPSSPDVVMGESIPVIGTFWYNDVAMEWETRERYLSDESKPYKAAIRSKITNRYEPLTELFNAKMREMA